MTKSEMMMLITNGAAGILGGAAQGQSNKISQQQAAQGQTNFALQQLLNSLQGQQQTGTQLQDRRQQGAQTQASMSPLGQEQSFVQKQRLLQSLLPAIAGFQPGGPTDPAIAGAFRPPTNILGALASPGNLQAVSDGATAQSLADRRQMMAQINPNFNFSSLDSFGLGKNYDQSFQGASMDARAQQTAFEAQQRDLAQRQSDLTQQAYNQAQQAQSSLSQKKSGGGVGGAIGGILKVASPFAALIPGVGPLAAMGIGAAASGLGSKLQGGGLGDVLLGGAIGAGGALGAEALQRGGNPFGPAKGAQVYSQAAGPSLNQMLPQGGFEGNMGGLPGMPQISTAAPELSGPYGGQVYSKPAGPNLSKMMNVVGGPKVQQQLSSPLPPMNTGGALQGPPQPNSIDDAWRKATGIGAQPQPGFLGQLGNNMSGQPLWDLIERLSGQSVANQPALGVLGSPMGALMTGGVMSGIPAAASGVGTAMKGAKTIKGAKTLTAPGLPKGMTPQQIMNMIIRGGG